MTKKGIECDINEGFKGKYTGIIRALKILIEDDVKYCNSFLTVKASFKNNLFTSSLIPVRGKIEV